MIGTIAIAPEEPELAEACLERCRAALSAHAKSSQAPLPRLTGKGLGDGVLRIDARLWLAPDPAILELDAAIFDAQPGAIAISGPAELLPRVAVQALTRYQAIAPVRNASSRTPAFDALLALHRDIHELSKPLVHADYFHALDTWQWMLRLEPDASFALQAAALLHDVERLASEADVRVEHRAADYQAFKDAHALTGARIVRDLLGAIGLEGTCADRAVRLVARHERPDGDAELALLNDADALSFFSLNAFGYLRYFGPEQTARKVAYTLARMRPGAREHLRALRLPEPVRLQLAAGGAA